MRMKLDTSATTKTHRVGTLDTVSNQVKLGTLATAAALVARVELVMPAMAALTSAI